MECCTSGRGSAPTLLCSARKLPQHCLAGRVRPQQRTSAALEARRTALPSLAPTQPRAGRFIASRRRGAAFAASEPTAGAPTVAAQAPAPSGGAAANAAVATEAAAAATAASVAALEARLAALQATVTAQQQVIQQQQSLVDELRACVTCNRTFAVNAPAASPPPAPVRPFDAQRQAIGDRRYLGLYDARFHSTSTGATPKDFRVLPRRIILVRFLYCTIRRCLRFWRVSAEWKLSVRWFMSVRNMICAMPLCNAISSCFFAICIRPNTSVVTPAAVAVQVRHTESNGTFHNVACTFPLVVQQSNNSTFGCCP